MTISQQEVASIDFSSLEKPASNATLAFAKLGKEQVGKSQESVLAGAKIKGVLVGTLKNEMTNKEDFIIRRAEGPDLVVPNSGNLAYRMQNVELGTPVIIEYLGKRVIEEGKMKGKESHNFNVTYKQ